MKNDIVRIQKQIGPTPLKWDKTGKVVEVNQHDQLCDQSRWISPSYSEKSKVSHEFFPFTQTMTGKQLPNRLPFRDSTKVEGQKDALGVRKEMSVNTLPAAPESQLESPQGETEVVESGHLRVDTRATPPSNSQADIPNESSQPNLP